MRDEVDPRCNATQHSSDPLATGRWSRSTSFPGELAASVIKEAA
ncbi:MAG TPA: hypothetical protein VIP05_33290 [Burkholderiaceae bacterium]